VPPKNAIHPSVSYPPNMNDLPKTGALWTLLRLHEEQGPFTLREVQRLGDLTPPGSRKAVRLLRELGLITVEQLPQRGARNGPFQIDLTHRGRRIADAARKLAALLAREQAELRAERQAASKRGPGSGGA
jgi:Mn-dependent DtxR family transcriptional regulator